MKCVLPLLAALTLTAPGLHAWDYAGHRIVNQLALAGLPAEFPAFVHAPEAAERIAFLSGEPDRWRSVPDLPLRQSGNLDHYLDLEQLAAAGMKPDALSPLRLEFAAQFAAARLAHPEQFPSFDPAKDTDHTREWPGFLPWAIAESYARLKSAFAYLKAFEENGTPAEVANARADVIYYMGVMGHYVGDGAQPLHTTIHNNGWEGDNPHGYTTWKGFHAWIDGGFIARAGINYPALANRARPARWLAGPPVPDQRDPLFDSVMKYLVAQHARVEPLYQLDLAHKIGANTTDLTEGRAFIEEQLLRGGEMLASVWVTAWRNAPVDVYLRAQLLKRKADAAAVAP